LIVSDDAPEFEGPFLKLGQSAAAAAADNTAKAMSMPSRLSTRFFFINFPPFFSMH
jgi:hypothetical protein